MTSWQALTVIAIVAGLTFLTRALPFWLFANQDRPSAFLTDLNRLMPIAVIAILVVYCLQEVNLNDWQVSLAQLGSVLLAILIHLWRRNTLLSIGIATFFYMMLLQLVIS